MVKRHYTQYSFIINVFIRNSTQILRNKQEDFLKVLEMTEQCLNCEKNYIVSLQKKHSDCRSTMRLFHYKWVGDVFYLKMINSYVLSRKLSNQIQIKLKKNLHSKIKGCFRSELTLLLTSVRALNSLNAPKCVHLGISMAGHHFIYNL